MLRRLNPITKTSSLAFVTTSTTLGQQFRFNNTNNNNESTQSSTSSPAAEQQQQQKPEDQQRKSNRRATNEGTTNSSNQSSGQQLSLSGIPQGLEVYLSCVGIIAGWWYWNEASFRQVDRACEKIESIAKERTNKLNEAVQSTEKRWHDDVKGKENLLNKVQVENVRLAKMLDEVSNYLKKCNVPQP